MRIDRVEQVTNVRRAHALEAAQRAIGIADGQRPTEDQRTHPSVTAGARIHHAYGFAATNVVQLEPIVTEVLHLEDPAINEGPLGSQPRFVSRQ